VTVRKLLRFVSELGARRQAVVGINRRNVELVYAHNARRDYPIADDKLLTKEVLVRAGVPVSETLVVCRGLFEIAPTLEALASEEDFVVKPASASGGAGILVCGSRVHDGMWRSPNGAAIGRDKLHKRLADIVFGAFSKQMEDKAFVERRIRPHAQYSALYADGLCDVRVLVLEGVPVMAMVRVPTRRANGRANLHQGGIGLGVDLETGRTVTAVSRGRPLEVHPETGAPLLGIELPAWAATVRVARRAAEAVPLGYLGVDVVVDEVRGPLILEINARPGLEIQNVHGRGLARFIEEASQ
jgi:alpha-L-glutamate ligase-like protein